MNYYKPGKIVVTREQDVYWLESRVGARDHMLIGLRVWRDDDDDDTGLYLHSTLNIIV